MYPWRPLWCSDALRHLWQEKQDTYVATGHWEFWNTTNAIPLLMIKKPMSDGTLRLHTSIDTCEQNANTVKMSPLPGIEGILWNILRHKIRSLMDLKDMFEQICTVPEHVDRGAFTTPDSTMVSHVMEIGNCIAGATFQAQIYHQFPPFIGLFMDMYLDNVVIYSDSPEEHVKHCKMVIDVLYREKFYLSAHKLKFFAKCLKILGHIIDKDRLVVDPEKVDRMANWKVPTNKDLLSGFVGSVGYLARDCPGIRIPFGHLEHLKSLGVL